MLRRRRYFSPAEGGGEAGKEDAKAPEKAPAAVPKGGPEPVPYEVFKETNEKLRAAEAETAKLTAKIQGYEGWKAPKEVEDLLATEKARGETLLMMADKQVAPKYRGYMLDRLGQDKPEDPATYLDQLRLTEQAFFTPTAPGEAPPAKEPERTPPKSNPDGGAGSPAPGDGRPVSAADIDAMTTAEYLAWKKAGGLDRIRAAEATA